MDGRLRARCTRVDLEAEVSGKTVFSILDVTEFGAFVRAAIESPEFGFGSEVLACGDQISLNDLAQKWGELTRKKAAFAQIPEEVFLAAAPPPVAKELLSMLKSFKKYGYYGSKSIAASQAALITPATNWLKFVKKTDWKL